MFGDMNILMTKREFLVLKVYHRENDVSDPMNMFEELG